MTAPRRRQPATPAGSKRSAMQDSKCKLQTRAAASSWYALHLSHSLHTSHFSRSWHFPSADELQFDFRFARRRVERRLTHTGRRRCAIRVEQLQNPPLSRFVADTCDAFHIRRRSDRRCAVALRRSPPLERGAPPGSDLTAKADPQRVEPCSSLRGARLGSRTLRRTPIEQRQDRLNAEDISDVAAGECGRLRSTKHFRLGDP